MWNRGLKAKINTKAAISYSEDYIQEINLTAKTKRIFQKNSELTMLNIRIVNM